LLGAEKVRLSAKSPNGKKLNPTYCKKRTRTLPSLTSVLSSLTTHTIARFAKLLDFLPEITRTTTTSSNPTCGGGVGDKLVN
jgi:hypothetical protein